MKLSGTIFLIIYFNLIVFSQNNNKEIIYKQQIYNGLIKMDKSYFNHKQLYQNKIQFDTINIYNTSTDTLKMFFRKTPSYISIKLEPQILLPQQKGIIEIIYDASKNLDTKGNQKWGKDYKRFSIYVKGREKARSGRSDFITFRAFIVEDFSQLSKKELKKAPIIIFDTIVYDFGKVPQGTVITHDFLFENKGKRNLEIRYAKAC